VRSIDASDAFRLFSDDQVQDRWSKFFSPIVPVAPADYGEWGRYLLHHRRYRRLDMGVVAPLISRYFHPSEDVVTITNRLIDKYEVKINETVVVNYRGTDKAREVTPVKFAVWLEEIDRQLKKIPSTHRILIQTDQAQVQSELLERYGNRAFFFEELPVTAGSRGVHFEITDQERLDFGKTFLAAIQVLAQSATVITHTGNVALWTALYRGHTRNLIQMFGKPKR